MKKRMFDRCVPGIVLAMGLGFCQHHARAQEGIFADFNTSMGSFTCRLEYATAPRTVANFIGLATGQRSWLDLTNGAVRVQPFYDGRLFHRVITNFMIQGGSANGMGTDGPGYSFVDEFSPSLRHDSFGVLSMANSGPDSNGSQFFITVAPTPWLNDAHTVFGRLVGGSNVVYAISRVEANANNRPLTNVVIHEVTIRRVGGSAQGFDIHQQGLPVVTNANLSVAVAGANIDLVFNHALNADYRLYSSTNLTHWTGTRLGIITAPGSSNLLVTAGGAARFFRMAQVQYPPSLFVPSHVLGRTLTLNFSAGYGTMWIGFDWVGGADAEWTQQSPGAVLDYQWIQDPYRGRLAPIWFTAIGPLTLHLDFDSTSGGTFKGTLYPNSPVSGVFSIDTP